MVFLRQQLLFIFIAFLSTCVGVYVAWDMNLTWDKFYSYLISEKAIFSILFNYAVIQLFFIVVGRKYTALFLSQLFVIFLNFITISLIIKIVWCSLIKKEETKTVTVEVK